MSVKKDSHILSAEKAVLGAIFLDHQIFSDVSEFLSSHDFLHVFHQAVFEAMGKLYDANGSIDIVSIENMLSKTDDKRVGKKNLTESLVDLTRSTPTTKNVMSYVEIVTEASMRRACVTIAGNLISDVQIGTEDVAYVLDQATDHFMKLSERTTNADTMYDSDRALNVTVELLERNFQRRGIQGGLLGVSTGIPDLDELTLGFCPSDLIIVAARPSMGKTTFALNCFEAGILNNSTQYPSVFFSLEMPTDQLMFKILSSISRVDLMKFRNGNLEDDDWARVSAAMEFLKSRGNYYIDDDGAMTTSMMRTKLRRLKKKYGGISGIYVDYIQLMRSAGEQSNRTIEVGAISGALKGIAKEFKCPVVALSQLNRSLEARSDKRPINSDLRESGSLEQDADVILFIYRDEIYNVDSPDVGVAEIIIGKQRNGPLGNVRVGTKLEISKFYPF